MTTKETTCNCLVCDICGEKNNAQVISAIKPCWSDPLYIQEVYWCVCQECMSKVDLTVNLLEE